MKNDAIRIQILSIGRGVPEDAQRAYREINELAKQWNESGITVQINDQVLGFEGERQLCINFEDAQQDEKFYTQIGALYQDIKLIRITRADCDTTPRQ